MSKKKRLFSEATSRKLIEEAQSLYDSIENDGGFNSCDVMRLEFIREELANRGFAERKVIAFVNVEREVEGKTCPDCGRLIGSNEERCGRCSIGQNYA